MVKIVKVTDKDYYMDDGLRQQLDGIKKAIKKDWDFVFLIDGMEGAGKSVFAFQLAYYLDPTFNVEDIAFNAKEFKEKVLGAKKFKAIVFDEALSGLSARQSMWLVNIAIVDMLAEIRQKNLFIFVVLPTFFDLDRNVAIWRSRILLHLYVRQNLQRGYWGLYNHNAKKLLYLLGKKTYSYTKVKALIGGRFTNFYTVDEIEYRKRKLKNLRSLVAPQQSYPKLIMQRDLLIKILFEQFKMKTREITKLIDLSQKEVQLILRKMRKQA